MTRYHLTGPRWLPAVTLPAPPPPTPPFTPPPHYTHTTRYAHCPAPLPRCPTHTARTPATPHPHTLHAARPRSRLHAHLRHTLRLLLRAPHAPRTDDRRCWSPPLRTTTPGWIADCRTPHHSVAAAGYPLPYHTAFLPFVWFISLDALVPLVQRLQPQLLPHTVLQ